jgi:hypothetical protein
MLERRALVRLPIYRPAMIHFARVRGVHPCVVENVHFQGACVSAHPYYIFANDFELSFDGFTTMIQCRVVWRNGHRCGVRFLGRRSETGFIAPAPPPRASSPEGPSAARDV